MIHKKHLKIFTLFLIFIVITSFVIYMMEDSNNNGITAKQAKDFADPYAKNWSENATLIQIGTSPISESGKADTWYVMYELPTKIGTVGETKEFKVFSNGTVKEIFSSSGKYWGKSLEENWSIDSDKLIAIATSDERMKEWLSNHHDAEIEDFGIGINLEYSENPICVISWMSWGLWDNPQSARIIIDANTGEVLYVEAAPGSSLSLRDVCIGFFIVLIAVVAAVVLIVRKKSMKEQEKRRLEEEKINMEKEIRKWDEEHGKKG